MHYHCEVVLPPMPEEEIYGHIEHVLKTFSEEYEDEDGYRPDGAFWDWWVIGGRFSGDKLIQTVDQDDLKAFYDKLNEMETKVSGVQCGKQQLAPEFVEKVDKLWREMFPDSGYEKCPIFNHSADQYAPFNNAPGNIMRLGDITSQSCFRVIFVSHDSVWDGEKEQFLQNGMYKANAMYAIELWNGTSFQDTAWDGSLKSALNDYLDGYQVPKPGSAYEDMIPNEDWLVVTVDYHC